MTVATPARFALRIGALELSSPVLIAPMVGITDVPCRELALEFGAGLVSTEMLASEALVRSRDASLHLLDFPAGLGPAGAQLVGCDPSVMADAAQICVERGAEIIDVNLGCPVKKVVGRGSGAALARDVPATATVLRAMVDAVAVPVTAKMRLGWDTQSINAPELARALADVGVSAITVHGRTRCQGYAGDADWQEIARVKEAVGIPVIGSGDVEDVRLIERRIRAGVVDGVVIARGMLGNFWLIRQATHLLATGEVLDDLDFAARMTLCRRHLDMLIAYHGAQRALRVGRKYVAWSIKGCNGAARLRAMVQELDSLDMLDTIFEGALAAGLGPEGWFRPIFTSGEG